VIEGVHLSVDVMRRLMTRFDSVICFVVVIKNDAKHKERFAVRSKYMTLDPKFNKYIEHFSSIRAI
jgi:2-phosphoglycerate kinase